MTSVPLFSFIPEKGNTIRNNNTQPADIPTPALPKLLSTKAPHANITAVLLTKLASRGDSSHVQTTKAPTSAPEKPRNPTGNSSLQSFFVFLSFFCLWHNHYVLENIQFYHSQLWLKNICLVYPCRLILKNVLDSVYGVHEYKSIICK